MIYKIHFDLENALSLEVPPLEYIQRTPGFMFRNNGESVKDQWVQYSGQFYQYYGYTKHQSHDISQLNGALVFPENKLEKIKPLIESYGEFLPVSTEDGTWFVFNTTTVINLIDEINSKREVDPGGSVTLRKLIFLEDMIEAPLFKSDYDDRAQLYCTDVFKRLIEDLGWKGLIFDENLCSQKVG